MTARLRLLTAGVLLLWGLLAIRLVHLQWHEHKSLSQHAIAQRALDEVIPARLGDIVDRHGRLLATTCTSHSLFVDPSRIDDPESIAALLAEGLGINAEALANRMTENSRRRFLWIKRRLSEREVDAMRSLNLPEHVWGLREERCRAYPQGTIAAHVLGWRNIDGVPQAGVEQTANSFLEGIDGRRTLVRDARGFVVEVLQHVTQPPQHGATVALTLDLDVQRIAEDRLDRLVSEWRPRSASVVVLDPQTGEILAITSRPTFDPNQPWAFPVDAWANHAVSSAWEPGSTIKPCIAAWAVDREVVLPEKTFACNGSYRMGSRVLHDHRPFGTLNLIEIIARSSNVGMAQIGERMGNDGLFAALRDFGFGRPTGVELPNESSGIVRPLEEWDTFSTGSIPMGQEMSATPLQVIAAHAALANGGRLITPHLLLHNLTRSDTKTPAANPLTDVLATRVLTPQTAHWITTGPMAEVVRSGTGRQAAISGLDVFAKTGTAQKFDAEAGAYSEDRFVSSCVCGAPAESPRLLVLVTVDEPTSQTDPYGGVVAAPAAADILKLALDRVKTLPTSSDALLRAMSKTDIGSERAQKPVRR